MQTDEEIIDFAVKEALHGVAEGVILASDCRHRVVLRSLLLGAIPKPIMHIVLRFDIIMNGSLISINTVEPVGRLAGYRGAVYISQDTLDRIPHGAATRVEEILSRNVPRRPRING